MTSKKTVAQTRPASQQGRPAPIRVLSLSVLALPQEARPIHIAVLSVLLLVSDNTTGQYRKSFANVAKLAHSGYKAALGALHDLESWGHVEIRRQWQLGKRKQNPSTITTVVMAAGADAPPADVAILVEADRHNQKTDRPVPKSDRHNYLGPTDSTSCVETPESSSSGSALGTTSKTAVCAESAPSPHTHLATLDVPEPEPEPDSEALRLLVRVAESELNDRLPRLASLYREIGSAANEGGLSPAELAASIRDLARNEGPTATRAKLFSYVKHQRDLDGDTARIIDRSLREKGLLPQRPKPAPDLNPTIGADVEPRAVGVPNDVRQLLSGMFDPRARKDPPPRRLQ